jgi:hypothetical protein
MNLREPQDPGALSLCTTRIEVPLFVSDTSERDPDLETSLILCNFAVSQYLASTAVDGVAGSVKEKLRQDAHRVFNLVSNLVDNRLAACRDELEEASLMAIGLHLTGNIVAVLRETGQAELADMFADRHRVIMDATRHNRVMAWCREAGMMAAAPAA